MPREHPFIFPLLNGLHARPASHLQSLASRFVSEIRLLNHRNGTVADARSVLGLISSDTRPGDSCVLTVEGSDEAVAFSALVHYLNHEFLQCDEVSAPAAPADSLKGKLPLALTALGVEHGWTGQPACAGLALAPLVCLGGLTLADGFSWPPAQDSETERARLATAIDEARAGMEREIARVSGPAAEILRAQADMVADRALASRTAEHLERQGGTAGEAVLAVTAALTETLRAGSAYLQERVADIQDVAARLLTGLYGETAIRRSPRLAGPAILAAADLTPGQFLSLDREHLRGLVLENCGATSHTAILARAAGVPLLAGVKGAASLPAGAPAILDARRGILLVNPTGVARRFYEREAARIGAADTEAQAWRDRPAVGADGEALPLYANVATAREVAFAVARGADGVGLFRTELLFMNRSAAPDEAAQFEIYAEAVRHAAGRPLVIRTLDIGGDKPVAYLDLPVETNPFLGLRGVRLYPRLAPLVRTQLRALLRASAVGPLKIMVPMIACAEEMAAFRALVEDVKRELTAEGHALGETVAIGAMIEIPSAVFALPEIARHADFFSVGSNDLAQYFLAADRDNSATAELGTWKHPAFIRLLRMAVEAAHAAGRPVGLCGDLASRPESLPLLFGLGFDSISLGAAGIATVKNSLFQLTRPAARERLERVLAAGDRADVDRALSHRDTGAEMAALDLELIDLSSDATTKPEVINDLVALLDRAGRTSDAIALENAVWAREATYSTGFGHGFAVPHCKSPHVAGPAIALIRLRTPVDWDALDGAPVRVALLLAMPEGDNRAHLQLFARLSRLIMRDAFRAALEDAPDAAALLTVLREALPQTVTP